MTFSSASSLMMVMDPSGIAQDWGTPVTADDRRLLSAAQRERHEFGAIYARHAPAVFRYLVRRTGRRDLAEDLTTEVFVRGFEAIERLEWRGIPLDRWLIRIAERLATDWFRQSARRPTAPLDRELAGRGSPSAEDDALAEANVRAVYDALDRLTPNRRVVVVLHLGEGLSLRAVAARLGRKESAVRMLYLRALRDLRARLRDE